MLLLALSCLQGKDARKAVEELLSLEPDGLQLTPGNLPDLDFQAWVTEQNVPIYLHHGFDWTLRRRPVWVGDKCVALSGATVHAPQSPHNNDYMNSGVTLEVMYPGYGLGTGTEVEEAMERNVSLAIDVSHIYLQICRGTMTEQTWKRVQEYKNIAEVHVSANDGHADLHSLLTESSFGLGWALEKAKSLPMVLECYMHRLSVDERKEQLELLRGT